MDVGRELRSRFARVFWVLFLVVPVTQPVGSSPAAHPPPPAQRGVAPPADLAHSASSPGGPLVGAGTPLPILQGATWAYFKGTVEPPATWNTIAFDDSSWLTGPSGFGYGDGDDATVLSDMQNGYLSVYTRRQFDVPNAGAIGGLELTVNWDDGFVAFINGQEVARRNLAGTSGTLVAHDIAASSHEAGTSETIPVSSSVLVDGTNVIAVQAHNVRLDSSDLSLSVALRATNPPPAPPTGMSPVNGASDVPLNPNLCVTVSDPNDANLDVTLFGREVTAPAADPFTIIALPDTQFYSQDYPSTYTAQTQWIVDNRVSRNIAFVTELGDCVNVASTEAQWINADAAWDIVEDPLATGLTFGLPYGIAVGNHDQTPAGDPGTFASEGSTTSLYNTYFGVARFAGRGYYGGHYGINNDNHYELFQAGGMDFVAIHMEYMPTDTPLRQAALQWADDVLKAYPNHRGILTAHYLINPGDASWGNQGLATWEALKDNHNLSLMFCGHLDQANRRYDEFTDGTGTTRTHTMVSDYQTVTNGGNGWLRILTFHPDTDTIDVETYSPTLGVVIDNHPNNTAGTARNRFSLTYDMAGGAPFAPVGAGSGSSGSQVCVPWSGRQPSTNYEWYAVVSDGVSSIGGTTSSFTTGLGTCSFPSDCNDADACTTDDCVSGSCQFSPIAGCCTAASDCGDGNACTDDDCTAASCQHTNNTSPCDDGDACTVSDVCAGGVCAGLANACDDGNACTADSCVAGACVNTYSPFAGCCAASDDCDDGVQCSADFCQGGTCVNTADANCCDTDAQCDDGEACTTDTCAPTNSASVTLNGTSAYVAMGPAPGLGAAQFTIETWFMRTAAGVGNTTGGSGIASLVPLVAKGAPEADGSNVDANYILGINTAGNVLAADFEDAATGLNHPVSGATTIVNGTWYHAAATYDGTTWRLYLNGNLDATLVVGAFTPRSDSIQPAGFGTMQKSALAPGQLGFFAGQLDEVRIWNLVRTAAEIQAGMTQHIASAAGLVGRWGLNEGSGSTAGDSTTADSETGTLTGGATWGAGAPAIASGTCTHGPVTNCCHSDAECDDANLCTGDACEGTICENVAIAGCCVDAADCDDGDVCTDDACVGNLCANTPNTACCESAADCDDGDACTSDSCSPLNPSALSLDGNGDYATMGGASGLNASPAFTVEAWINGTGGQALGSTGTGGISSVVPLVSKGGPQTESPIELNMNYLLGLKSGTLVADFEDDVNGTNHPICGSTSISAGWHHVAATYDGTSWMLYVDGAAETLSVSCSDCPACTASPGVAPVGNSTQHFAIGTSLTSTGSPASSGSPSTPGYYGGTIDEVRVWSVARTQLQIQADMGHEVLTAPNLIGRWGLNEGTGTVVGDATTPAENGSFAGTPAWESTDVPFLGEGTCSNEPVAGCCASSAECDDADPCTTDSCDGNTCSHESIVGCCVTAADCNDDDVCTDDACVTSACAHTPNTAPCSDGDACTTGDACSGGICAGTSVAGSCDDANACTVDSCGGTSAALGVIFDGTDDYVSLGNPVELRLSQFTIETWFKRTGAGTANQTGSGGIPSLLPLIAKGAPEADGSNLDANYILGINTAGNVLAADFEDTATGLNHPISGTTPILNGTWYHAAATYDGTTWRLYLDGNLEAMLAVGAFTPRSDSIQPAGLGAMQTSSGSRLGAFQGVLDEVRIWSFARSQADVQDGMPRQITSLPGLVARWGLDESSGSVAGDSTVPASDGVLTNFNLAAARVAGAPSLSTALCSYVYVSDGATCDDLNGCTAPDACGGGSCSGAYAPTPGCCTTSAECDDNNVATTDSCSGGICENALPTNCTASPQCDDGNSCTTDVCAGGNASALNFDGTNDYVTMGAAAGESALGARAFTLEAWIKRDGASWGATASTGTGGVTAVPLVTKGRGEAENSNVDCNYFLGITTAGRLAADFEQFSAGGGWSAGQNHPGCSAITIADQGWHHVAVTYSATTGWSFYVDGVAGTAADGTACATGGACSPAGSCPQSPGVEPRYDSVQHFGVGSALTSAGVPSGFYAGMMDEVRVWNRVLTSTEVLIGKDQEIASGTGLLGRWGLSENGGTAAADSAAPAQNGILTESTSLPVVPANGPAWSGTDRAPIAPGTCERSAIPGCCNVSADCNDGDACNGAESCSAGTCQAGTAPDCDDADVCTLDACAPATGCTSALQDADGDGTCDALDCAPNDVGAFATPAEASGLRFDGDKVTLTWTSVAPAAGNGTVHELLRGVVAELPVGSGPSESCLSAEPSTPSATDGATPVEGNGYWYLVRGRNACGAGPYGFRSDGTQETSQACP